MIIDARNGNTAYGRRPYGTIAEIAHFFSNLEMGQPQTIEKFITVKGEKLPLKVVQVRMGSAKPEGLVYRSSISDAGLTVERLA